MENSLLASPSKDTFYNESNDEYTDLWFLSKTVSTLRQDFDCLDEERPKPRITTKGSEKHLPGLPTPVSPARPYRQRPNVDAGVPQPEIPDQALSDPAQLTPDSEVQKNDPQDRAFKCEIQGCLKTFSQFAHLKIHQRSHTGEKPYVCTFSGCGKAFTQLGNLRTHERKHSGEKPFECSYPGCGKVFSQMGNMKTHEMLHLGVKPYICGIESCDRSFSQLGNLKVHYNPAPTRKRKRAPKAPEPVKVKPIKKVGPSKEEKILLKLKAVIDKSGGIDLDSSDEEEEIDIE